MKLFTSYFAMVKRIPENFQQFSIALRTPFFFKGPEVITFQPTSGMLFDYKIDHDIDKYIERYQRIILGRLDVHEYWREMEKSFGDQTVVFMCYEKPGDFCHRHIVAKWFTDAGYPVEELDLKGVKQ